MEQGSELAAISVVVSFPAISVFVVGEEEEVVAVALAVLAELVAEMAHCSPRSAPYSRHYSPHS